MDTAKRARLEAAGFKVGTVTEFLGMAPEEEEVVEIKLALERLLRALLATGATRSDISEIVFQHF